MSNSTESQPNPLPRLFAAALGLLLVAVIIAISLFGRFSYSPPASTSSDTQLTSNTPIELVRQRALTVMVSVGVMAGLVIIGGLAVSLLLNRRLNQQFTTAELWKNAHRAQPVHLLVDTQTMHRIQQASRTPRYADHISHVRRR